MQLLKRAANGNYAKLLEAIIEEYLGQRDNLHRVRGASNAFVISKQLCAFYGVYIPPIEEGPDEEEWLTQLRNNKPKYELHPPTTKFSELQLTAYMGGAIDYMLERPEVFGEEYDRFHKLYETKQIKKEAAEFLLELWAAGFAQQRKRFEHS